MNVSKNPENVDETYVEFNTLYPAPVGDDDDGDDDYDECEYDCTCGPECEYDCAYRRASNATKRIIDVAVKDYENKLRILGYDDDDVISMSYYYWCTLVDYCAMGTKELIESFSRKIKNILAKSWGDDYVLSPRQIELMYNIRAMLKNKVCMKADFVYEVYEALSDIKTSDILVNVDDGDCVICGSRDFTIEDDDVRLSFSTCCDCELLWRARRVLYSRRTRDTPLDIKDPGFD